MKNSAHLLQLYPDGGGQESLLTLSSVVSLLSFEAKRYPSLKTPEM